MSDQPSSNNPDPRPPDHGTLSSKTIQGMLDWIDENYEEIIYPEGFENCILGVGERWGGPPVAIMDVEAMLDKIMADEDLSRHEALEHFEFNILGAYVGDLTPIYMHIPGFKHEAK